jgi:hypothetical protein
MVCCPFEEVPCSYAWSGCSIRVQRQAVASHVAECKVAASVAEAERLRSVAEAESKAREQAARRLQDLKERRERAEQQAVEEEERDRQSVVLQVQKRFKELCGSWGAISACASSRVIELYVSSGVFRVLATTLMSLEPESLLAEFARDASEPTRICLNRDPALYPYILEWLARFGLVFLFLFFQAVG